MSPPPARDRRIEPALVLSCLLQSGVQWSLPCETSIGQARLFVVGFGPASDYRVLRC